MATSYNGWPASSDPDAIGVVHFEPIPGYDFPGGVKKGDVHTVFTYLVQQLHTRVEPIVIYPPGDEWGYAFRDNVNNPGQLSCHASATAIDYNATEHPNKVPYTWTRAQVRMIHAILDECSGVVRWLEGYDEMHFEIRGTAAAVKAAAAKIKAMSETQEEPMAHYKIAWIRSGTKPVSAYRVLFAYGKDDKLVPVEAYDIVGQTSLDRWRRRLEEIPATQPLTANTFIRIMDGPYKNVT